MVKYSRKIHFPLQVTFSTKICHISFVNKNNNNIGRRPREKLTIFKNSKQWEPTQMKNHILYINLIASDSIIYERSSTAPPSYLYRVLLEIYMSFTEPLERPIVILFSHYNGLGPRVRGDHGQDYSAKFFQRGYVE